MTLRHASVSASGCPETVYVFGDKKEDIYSRPTKDDNADSIAEPENKPALPTHKTISVDYHEKDGSVFLISTAGGRKWLSAYRFADDDTLTQQIIYIDDGHQYTPSTSALPKWTEVSVQDGNDQLVRCGEEANAVINAIGNPDGVSTPSTSTDKDSGALKKF